MKHLLFFLLGLTAFSTFSQSVTFNYTGAVQTWTVPPCVYTINVIVAGAKGGGANGGNGARITANIAVTPGQILNIYCGGMGTSGNNSGGWNGGGTGHASTNGNANYNSWGGGGASDIRIGGTALANRVIVAGAGGGRSGGSSPVCGGAANCNNGAPGCNTYGQGGQGGTQVAGGAGGTPWAGTPPGGSPGTLGNGGQAGVWQTASGGGGGGGYYGGGGGGNDGCCTGANGGGGGGAGSSLVPAGGTCLANNNNNHGYVTINYQAGGINISASNTGPYCAGQTISLSATAGATTYSWTGPNGFTSNLQNPTIPNATPLDSGTYTLNYTTPNCNGTASTLVVVNTPINPAFTQINPICHNGAVPALPGTSNNVPTAITGTWNPPTISSASPGTFTYTFTPAAQFCANPATMNITILPNETPTFTQINPMCINSVPPVLPNPSTNATPYTGTWTPPTITTASAGTYTYTFTPTAGQCAVATTMDINILNYTYPTFQQIGPLCQYTQGVQLPASSTNITPITGNWSPANINTQQPGIFTYNFTPNPFQCSDTASMVIVINPLIIPQFTPMPLVCQGDIPPVFPLVSNNNPVIVGTWNPPTIDSSVPGTFTFDFTPSPNQCADSVSMNVIVVPSVPPSFVADTISGCNPLLVNFTSNPVAGASYTYLWNGNTIGTGPVIDYMFTAAGCHTITLQYNLQGCIETTTYTDYICMENYPNTSFTASPNVLSSTSETINFNNNTIGAINYFWEFGDGQTSSEFEGPHFYNGITENILVTLTGTTALGCATSFEVSLPVISDPIYYVPNTFTPDQDEHNQTWYPVFTTGYDPYNFNLKIYNRWGETVWESNDSKGEWDGTYGADGTKVQSGIYTWVIKYANKETDEKKVVTGFVNVLR